MLNNKVEIAQHISYSVGCCVPVRHIFAMAQELKKYKWKVCAEIICKHRCGGVKCTMCKNTRSCSNMLSGNYIRDIISEIDKKLFTNITRKYYLQWAL